MNDTSSSRSFTSYWSRCKISLNVILKIIGSLFVPFLLAIFTVIITFSQRDEARSQRQQDLSISREQRLEDQESARLQRMQEWNISIEQRELERELAAKTRALNHEQRLHELQIQSENRQDTLFANYLTEMGSFLLRESNGSSLSSDPKMAVLIQSKTLHVIRQIDVARKRQLIAFLYVSGQLYANRDPISLIGADLNNIDLQGHPMLLNISLAGTYLNNASFIGQDLSHADLSCAQINEGRFDRATCQNINFAYSNLNQSTFVGVNCAGASFHHTYLYEASFRAAKVMNANFDAAYLVNVDFSYSNLTSSSFIETNLVGALVDEMPIEHTMKFRRTNLAGINFTRVRFSNQFGVHTQFTDVNLVNTSFKNVKLEYVNFHYCNMTNVDFSFSSLSRMEFTGSTLINASFMNARLYYIFLTYTNLTYANFYNVHCAVHGCIWEKPLVFQNTIMPNGTIYNRITRSFLINGHADCNRSITYGWTKVSSPDAIIISQFRNTSICRFVPAKRYSDVVESFFLYANMSQEIEPGFYYNELIKASRALARIRARCGKDVTILLRQFDYPFRKHDSRHEIRRNVPFSNDNFYSVQIPLNRVITNLVFTIKFPQYNGREDVWCEFVELDITSSIKAPL
ncbi:hypothetical protein I4U23_015710 [Adineta vaga]|nr:hypothetical protein I4U23_015710 [Adineta vaga]